LNSDGNLLAFSGFHNKDARITSAIASNVWAAYKKHGNNSFREDPLNYLFIVCEQKIVIVTEITGAGLLLCLYADNNVGLGILKAKISKLKEILDPALQKISIA
jgi:predicted regulator of Ras-like GTPase activity (Roadblock/LC7/MglB family)